MLLDKLKCLDKNQTDDNRQKGFTFVLDNGSWLHFELQASDEGIQALKRYRKQEAEMSYQYNVPVTTYVLYSARIKNPVTEFNEGINTYRVHPIKLQDKNADELLQMIENRIINTERLTKGELVPLALCLMMEGESSFSDRVLRVYKIIKRAKGISQEDIDEFEAVLSVMAKSFLSEDELDELVEKLMKEGA